MMIPIQRPWIPIALLIASCGGASEPAPPAVSTVGAEVPELRTGEMEPLVAELLDERVAKVRAEPGDARAWSQLGFALDAHMLLAEAESCLGEAVRLDPTDFPAAYDFAFLGTLLPRDAEEVSERFARASTLKPSYAPVFARHGDYLFEGGEVAKAVACYESAIAAFDGYDYARLGLARALLESDQPAEMKRAHDGLERLFETFPGDPAVATAFGQALSLRGEAERAATVASLHSEAVAAGNSTRVPLLDSLRADILSLSRSTASNFQRGEKKLRKGDLAGAAIEFERVLSAEPSNRTARLFLAKTRIGLRKLDEARAHLAVLMEANPRDADAHALLGQLDTEAGAFDSALDHFAKVAQAARPDDLTYRAWVTALGSNGRWEEALFRLEEWESSSPTHPEIGYLRALASHNAGQTEEARRALEAATERAPNHPMRRQVEQSIGR